jgi:hypothetical protein
MAVRKVTFALQVRVLSEGKKVVAVANFKYERVQQVVDLLKNLGFSSSNAKIIEDDLHEERSVGLHGNIYEVDIDTISSK